MVLSFIYLFIYLLTLMTDLPNLPLHQQPDGRKISKWYVQNNRLSEFFPDKRLFVVRTEKVALLYIELI